MAIFAAAKDRGLDAKVFGQHAFFQALPEEKGSRVPKATKNQLDDWYISQEGT